MLKSKYRKNIGKAYTRTVAFLSRQTGIRRAPTPTSRPTTPTIPPSADADTCSGSSYHLAGNRERASTDFLPIQSFSARAANPSSMSTSSSSAHVPIGKDHPLQAYKAMTRPQFTASGSTIHYPTMSTSVIALSDKSIPLSPISEEEIDAASTTALYHYPRTDSVMENDNDTTDSESETIHTNGKPKKDTCAPSSPPNIPSNSDYNQRIPPALPLTTDTSSLPAPFLAKWTRLHASDPTTLPFPKEKPPFPLTATDEQHLRLPDTQFTPHTWDDLKHLIGTGQLHALKRFPSHMKAYLDWSAHAQKLYGSDVACILSQRLGWVPMGPLAGTATHLTSNSDSKSNSDSDSISSDSSDSSGSSGSKYSTDTAPLPSTPFPLHFPFHTQTPHPFAHPSDYAILTNDWPYAVEPGIKHMVAWSKIRVPVDEDGVLTPLGEELIEGFVTREFRIPVGEEEGEKGAKVLWFRNPTGLQSVRSLEHVHVLVRE